MINLHTASDVSRFIGALEFGTDLPGGNDGALETVGTNAAPTRTSNPVYCHHIDDGALEAAGKAITAAPTHLDPITRRCL
jgi:hypothetical protein